MKRSETVGLIRSPRKRCGHGEIGTMMLIAAKMKSFLSLRVPCRTRVH